MAGLSMPAIAYPLDLPGPSVATLTPDERRALSSLPGPRSASVRQRDFGAVQRIEFAALTQVELSAFRSWWRETLVQGGAWFAADWPLPAGMVTGVRKFLGEPTRTYIAGGYWRLSGLCEVRGRGELPQTPMPRPLIDLRFEAGEGGSTFPDLGGSTWVASGAITSTDAPLAGVSSLLLADEQHYLQTPYTSANRIPALADFDLSFLFRSTEITSDRYVLSVYDVGTTAAGSVFSVYSNLSALQFFFVVGPPGEEIFEDFFSVAYTPGDVHLYELQRRGTELSLFVDAVLNATVSFPYAVKTPPGLNWRIGKPPGAGRLALSEVTLDNVVLRAY